MPCQKHFIVQTLLLTNTSADASRYVMSLCEGGEVGASISVNLLTSWPLGSLIHKLRKIIAPTSYVYED